MVCITRVSILHERGLLRIKLRDNLVSECSDAASSRSYRQPRFAVICEVRIQRGTCQIRQVCGLERGSAWIRTSTSDAPGLRKGFSQAWDFTQSRERVHDLPPTASIGILFHFCADCDAYMHPAPCNNMKVRCVLTRSSTARLDLVSCSKQTWRPFGNKASGGPEWDDGRNRDMAPSASEFALQVRPELRPLRP